jgi:multidrug efflux system membrane fusion protein
VTVSQQDETQSVVARGLQPDERVVTTGFARLTAGAEVTVTNAEAVPATAQPGEAQQERRPGRERRRERRSEARPSAPQ